MKKFRGDYGRKKNRSGQALTEYAFMLTCGIVFAIMFFVLLAVFSEYGARLIGLVSWESSPPSRSQMENIMKGNL